LAVRFGSHASRLRRAAHRSKICFEFINALFRHYPPPN
jgi:hypothetical protein